jgi:anti-sigma factor RsiW
MKTEELACRELVELVTEYLEGALPAAERARFEAHLTGCDGCRTYVEEFRETIRLAGHLEPGALSPEARDGLLAAFREWKR